MSSKGKQKRNVMNIKNGNGNNFGAQELSSVTFKYPGRFATLKRTVLLNENLTISDLIQKITLNKNQECPTAKGIFQIYFYDEIYPFINKHAQETINTKKEIAKSWDLQTTHFQNIYFKRQAILKKKWCEISGKSTHSNSSSSSSSSSTSSTSSSYEYQRYNKINNPNHYNNGQSSSSSYLIKNKMSKINKMNNDTTNNSMTVIFKYYSVHSSAKTNRHIIITEPTKKELLNKIQLNVSSNPPNAKELFEIYYYDEILPFLKKSGQQSIRGKKDLSKIWQIQTKTFKNLYEDRSKILQSEWLKLKQNKSKKKGKRSHIIKEQQKQRQKEREQRERDQEREAQYDSVSISPSNSSSKKIMYQMPKIKKIINTLLNFLLFIECTKKDDCFMVLVTDQNESKYDQFTKFIKYLKKYKKTNPENMVYFHIRIYVDNFDQSSLRLHSGKKFIKLCFVNNFYKIQKEEELVLFELKFDDLIEGLEAKIDDENISAALDQESGILAINVPMC